MVRWCAWCDSFIGIKLPVSADVTHGICDTCRARYAAPAHIAAAVRSVMGTLAGGATASNPPQETLGEESVPELSPSCGAGTVCSPEL